MATYVCPRACEENASLYAAWIGFTAPYIAVHWCTWTYSDANHHIVHQRPECVDVRRRMQGWRKKCKVQNMPLIWHMSDHATHSSHVTDHFLSTLLSLRYTRCVACCWKSGLTPAVLCWKAPRRRAALRRASPCVSRPNALADRIVSYRIAIFCLISYRIYRFLLWLYRAITKWVLSVEWNKAVPDGERWGRKWTGVWDQMTETMNLVDIS